MDCFISGERFCENKEGLWMSYKVSVEPPVYPWKIYSSNQNHSVIPDMPHPCRNLHSSLTFIPRLCNLSFPLALSAGVWVFQVVVSPVVCLSTTYTLKYISGPQAASVWPKECTANPAQPRNIKSFGFFTHRVHEQEWVRRTPDNELNLNHSHLNAKCHV